MNADFWAESESESGAEEAKSEVAVLITRIGDLCQVVLPPQEAGSPEEWVVLRKVLGRAGDALGEALGRLLVRIQEEEEEEEEREREMLRDEWETLRDDLAYRAMAIGTTAECHGVVQAICGTLTPHGIECEQVQIPGPETLELAALEELARDEDLLEYYLDTLHLQAQDWEWDFLLELLEDSRNAIRSWREGIQRNICPTIDQLVAEGLWG